MENYWGNLMIGALVGAIVAKILDYFVSIGEYIKIWAGLIAHRREKIRISCGYLFRLKYNNRYLLIKGRRINQYQPVGGVYKSFDSFRDVANRYEIVDEREHSFYEKYDLRIYLPGKNVIKFIRWFNTEKNREFTVTREFYEELIATRFLPQESLLDAKFEFIKQAECRLRYSNAFRCKEILIHNVFDVSFSNSVFLDKLIESVENSGNELIWASETDILREAVNIDGVEVKIGAHAKNVL